MRSLSMILFMFVVLVGCNTTESQKSETTATKESTANEEKKKEATHKPTTFGVNPNIDLISYSLKKDEEKKEEDEKAEEIENPETNKPDYKSEPHEETLQITAQEANIRKGPATDYEKITTLSKHTKLLAIEKAKPNELTWFHVTFGEDQKGWISSKIVEKYDPQSQKEEADKVKTSDSQSSPKIEIKSHKETYEISASVANIRKGPGLSYHNFTGLKRFTKVEAFEKTSTEGMTWYHVKFNGQKGWVAESVVQKYNPNRQVKLISAPLVSQMPELPRGCEVTSLAMLLGHAGVQVDKMTLAKEIKKDPTPYTKKNGQVHFGNPYDGFVGDMYSFDNPGLGVYHGPIAELGEKYLPGRIVDLTGQSFDAVYQQLDKGKPVWVETTSWFSYVPESEWYTWNTPSGKIKITYKLHSVLVTGYDENYIYFNDPLANQKNRKVNKKDFITGWKQIGNQAISYK
ncbi:C39 family peptidase [Salinibacillus xinjiangensis]|nr:C39 family peptidase [Salinibacillus xinjiangensis]